MLRKRKTIITMAILLLFVSMFAQGLAINIIMRKVTSELDMRFVHGEFFWKPELPPLFRSAKAGIVSAESRAFTFSPPFTRTTRSN